MSYTNFPINLDSFVDPTGTESESIVDHSLQHDMANDAIGALETKVGIDNSADVTSQDYLLKQSVNPGHTHTDPATIEGIGLLPSSAPSGPGIYASHTYTYIQSGGSTGGVVVYPIGANNTGYQVTFGSNGAITTSDSTGVITNTLDDGSGNTTISGNLTINGNLSVVGSFGSASFTFGMPSNSAIGDVAAEGTSTAVSHSDHVHGRESFSTAAPTTSLPGDAANTGSLPNPSHSDHKHARESFYTTLPQTLSYGGSPGGSGQVSDGAHVHPYGALANSLQVIGTGGSLDGSGTAAPSTPNAPGRPIFYVQGGEASGTTGNDGIYTFVFPVSFPSYLLSFVAIPVYAAYDNPQYTLSVLSGTPNNKGQVQLLLNQAASFSFTFSWMAIGW